MKKNLVFIFALVIIVIFSAWLYQSTLIQEGYRGLPAVRCIDPTLPVTQNFTFTVLITVNGKSVPLDPDIGHDPGQCVRVISTNDSSGTVDVKSNDSESYTLGEFFNVWHKQFTTDNFMGNPINNDHQLAITIDGKPVSTFTDTPLSPGESITVKYQEENS